MYVHDVTYLKSGDLALQARVYRPDGDGPFPTLLDVHGGAWVHGTRLNDVVLDSAIANAGFLVVAVDFRQPPEHPFPAPSVDVHFAVRWLKLHAQELGGNSDRIAALGSSSGGQVAGLVGLRPFDPMLAEWPLDGVDATLACLIGCWPILDPSARYAFAQQTGRSDLLEAHQATFVPLSRMDEANPRMVVERGEAQRLPPVLILQGSTDRNVTPSIQARFKSAYESAGGECDLAIFEGLPHGFGSDAAEGTHQALARIIPFLQEHLAATRAAGVARPV
jgi:acetyl esterase/lipase